MNLAAFLGIRTNQKVALVDLNTQQADVAKYLNVARERTVVDVVKNLATITPENIREYLPWSQAGSFSALLGPYLPRQADPNILRPEVYHQILGELRQVFDYVILDTPVAEYFHPLIAKFALPVSDHIVTVATPNWATVTNVHSFLRAITEEETGPRIPSEKIGWILNQAQDNIDCDLPFVQQNLARWRYLGQVPHDETWLKAANNFQMAVTYGDKVIDDAFAEWVGNLLGVAFDGGQATVRKRGLLSWLRKRK